MTGALAPFGADGDPLPPAMLVPFGDVYARHAPGVHRFCLSQVGDAEAAADLTHETFVKAFSAYDRVRPDPGSVRTWLVAIARNCCTDHHRRSSRWHRLLWLMQQRPEGQAAVEDLVQWRAELERVNSAMARLRRRERELIGLRVSADLSYREAGEVLGISEQVAKVATRRALTKLRAQLEDHR